MEEINDINIPTTMPPDTSIFSDPHFILGALVVMLIGFVIVKLFFTNTQSEYVYNPQMD